MSKQLSFPGVTVKKHNELTRSKINVTNVNSSRIIANLIACISIEDKDFKDVYSISLTDILPENASGQTYSYYKSACKDLTEANVELERPDLKEADYYPFFTSIKLRGNTILATFNPFLKDLLIGLRSCFTQYNLFEYLELPSTYSQKIFELLKSWSGAAEFTISIEKLHHLLDTPESSKKNFAEFRRRVLEKAHKDIHELTSLSFEWEPIKKGRRFDSIRFIFSKPRRIEQQAKEETKRNIEESKKSNYLVQKAVSCYKEKGMPESCKGENRPECQTCFDLVLL